jgi:hypothetical protein
MCSWLACTVGIKIQVVPHAEVDCVLSIRGSRDRLVGGSAPPRDKILEDPA